MQSDWTISTSTRIVDGIDELGVLLYGHAKERLLVRLAAVGSRNARLGTLQNATGLQVTSAGAGGMVWRSTIRQWASPKPTKWIRRCLEVQLPYSRTVEGHYTDWTPLAGRPGLFPEDLDTADPWSFRNILVRVNRMVLKTA